MINFDLPFWLEIGKTIIGPLIAAVVVVVGLIWRDRIERRNAAQSWYEQTYIAEGIDVLVAHLSALQDSSIAARRDLLPKSAIQLLPAHVPGRLAIVVPSVEFFFACDTVEGIMIAASRSEHPVILSPKELTELYLFTGHLLQFAERIRLVLLNVTVRAKREVYDIHLRRSLIKVLKDAENQFLNGETLEVVHRRLIEQVAERAAQAAIATMTESQKEQWRQ